MLTGPPLLKCYSILKLLNISLILKILSDFAYSRRPDVDEPDMGKLIISSFRHPKTEAFFADVFSWYLSRNSPAAAESPA